MAKPKSQVQTGSVRDVMPPAAAQHAEVRAVFMRVAIAAGFEPIQITPQSEINHMTLVTQAAINHGMPLPQRLVMSGPQPFLAVLGNATANADAQVISLALRLLRTLRIPGVTVTINSLGDGACAPRYRRQLVDFLLDHERELHADDVKHITTDPRKVLTSQHVTTTEVVAQAPQMLNVLCSNCKTHVNGVLEYLDALRVTYELDPFFIPNGTGLEGLVFAIHGEQFGIGTELALGGRQNDSVGLSLSTERIVLSAVAAGIELRPQATPPVYVASLGELAQLVAFTLIEELLDAGVAAVGSITSDSISGQLERAMSVGAPYVVIMGHKEVRDGSVLLRHLPSGAQETVPLKSLVGELSRRLHI